MEKTLGQSLTEFRKKINPLRWGVNNIQLTVDSGAITKEKQAQLETLLAESLKPDFPGISMKSENGLKTDKIRYIGPVRNDWSNRPDSQSELGLSGETVYLGSETPKDALARFNALCEQFGIYIEDANGDPLNPQTISPTETDGMRHLNQQVWTFQDESDQIVNLVVDYTVWKDQVIPTKMSIDHTNNPFDVKPYPTKKLG